jgi:hypothetical protein
MKFATTLFAALVIATAAVAGDDHDHKSGEKHEHKAEKVEKAADTGGHDHSGKRGGLFAESGHHHLELVAKDGTLELYVDTEEGKPEDIAGAKATATVLSGGKKVDVTLAPADGAMKGAGEFTAKGSTIVISLTMPDHKPEQVRFKVE